MKKLTDKMHHFFAQNKIARIVLYLFALITPANILIWGTTHIAVTLWISFYSCIVLVMAFPKNTAEQIFSFVLIGINLIPIGLLLFGSLMLGPAGILIAFIQLWIPRLPFAGKEVSIGLLIIIVILVIAFAGKLKAEEKSVKENLTGETKISDHGEE